LPDWEAFQVQFCTPPLSFCVQIHLFLLHSLPHSFPTSFRFIAFNEISINCMPLQTIFPHPLPNHIFTTLNPPPRFFLSLSLSLSPWLCVKMLAMEELLCELTCEDINEQGLPPGFRFHPTDEELITFYLASKVFNGSFCGVDIAEVDLNRCEPWELPGTHMHTHILAYCFSILNECATFTCMIHFFFMSRCVAPPKETDQNIPFTFNLML